MKVRKEYAWLSAICAELAHASIQSRCVALAVSRPRRASVQPAHALRAVREPSDSEPLVADALRLVKSSFWSTEPALTG
jgi:hypothetical protein